MRRTGMVIAFLLLCAISAYAQVTVVATATNNPILTPGVSATATGVDWTKFRDGPSRWAQGFNAVMVNYLYECRVYIVSPTELRFFIPADVQMPPSIIVFNGDHGEQLIAFNTITPALPSLLSSGGDAVGLYFVQTSTSLQINGIVNGLILRFPGALTTVTLYGAGLGTDPNIRMHIELVNGAGVLAGAFLVDQATASSPTAGNESVSFPLSGLMPAGSFRARIRVDDTGFTSNEVNLTIVDVLPPPVILPVETPPVRRTFRKFRGGQ